MKQGHIIKVDEVARLERGGGIVSTPLITASSVPDAHITSGMSVFPPGLGAPLHSHNCDEQVTLLEGEGEVEIDGVVTHLQTHDTTYIPAGLVHAFRNTGAAPMRIMWIYTSNRVTRTLASSGETVEHLTPQDRLA